MALAMTRKAIQVGKHPKEQFLEQSVCSQQQSELILQVQGETLKFRFPK